MAIPVETGRSLAAKFEAVFPHLDERQRRLLAGAEARTPGHGGIRVVAQAAGIAEGTVSRRWTRGQRVGRPHVASWAETATELAADLMTGNDDPRAHAATLLRRAVAVLPARARAGTVRLRADAGYFAGELARAALLADVPGGVEFAIGARRIAPLWRLLDGVREGDWVEAVEMPGAQVAVAAWCPDWCPANTRLLIRRVRLDPAAGRISADPRSRRRRTLHPDQRALPLDELAGADAVYGYSFVVTNLDVSTPVRAAAVEHWYRHRTMTRNVFRDAKHGAALRHLPSGDPQVNMAWMWGALLAASAIRLSWAKIPNLIHSSRRARMVVAEQVVSVIPW
jgi:hypothetical protein